MPSTESLPAIEPRSSSRRFSRRLGRRLAFGLFWAGIVGMGVWNGRYLWVHRPLPDLKAAHRLIARHQDREAEAILRARLRQSPNEVASRILLARILGARGATAEAAAQLRAVPFWWPDKADCLYREGQAWISIDRARDAEKAWLAYLQDDPNHPVEKPALGEVESDLINLYGDQNRWPEARAIVWRSYDRVTTPAGKRELTMMALRTHIERIATEHALPRLRRYVAADPGDLKSRAALAVAAQEAGERSLADATLTACLEAWPDHPVVRGAQLQMLSARGDSPELEALLEHPPDSFKTLPLYWHLIGTRAFDREQWDAAIAAYREAVRLAPSQSEDLYKLAMAEKRMGHAAEAEAHFKEHAAMRAASSELTRAMNLYLDATTSISPSKGTPSPAEAARRVAEICRTLHWDREAEAWRRLAAQSSDRTASRGRGERTRRTFGPFAPATRA